ncbi:MAG: RT0821/Lpp0805 family surface protein [Inquilinaceae bacterium]
MNKIKTITAALVASAFLGACQDVGTKQAVGTGGGAIAGGLLGSQIGGGTGQLVATGAGALLGAFLGGEIGKSLDRADQAAANQAAQRAFETSPSGTTASWQNPDSGNRGTITPQSAYTNNQGRPCRNFTQTIYVDGQAQTANGTACRNADGTWTVTS